ncbi:hypothetical protein EDC04DRAFT_2916555 [Pisolithus marmoratus]|nr:hypothetical protein EDC04DRAFT_2916555 [Pisolithus marmoratus]
MLTLIFTDEFSDDNRPQVPNRDATSQVDEPPPLPTTVLKKRGRLSKKALSAGKEATELQEPSKPTSITFYLSLFFKAEMKKTVKQWKASNMFLQLKPDFEWDMVKAQFLMKITQMLQPKLIDFNDYNFTWNIPCQQLSQMQLQTEDDYKFLIAHALKMKEPTVNIKIEVRFAKKGRKNDSGTEHDMSDNSSNSDSDTSRDAKCVKKKSKKKSKDSKKSKETTWNKDTEEKIKLLHNHWECSKAACTSGAPHCFIHLESPEHFTLSHNHLAIWAAAWQCGPQFTDLERPPNHVKFNDICIGQTIDSAPLLQRCMVEHNQAISTAPIINFNLLPELFNAFHPPAAKPASPMQPISSATTADSLLPESAMPRPHLSLNNNGYTSSNTISYIHVSELRDMGFKHGEIMAMKDAVRQWIASN